MKIKFFILNVCALTFACGVVTGDAALEQANVIKKQDIKKEEEVTDVIYGSAHLYSARGMENVKNRYVSRQGQHKYVYVAEPPGILFPSLVLEQIPEMLALGKGFKIPLDLRRQEDRVADIATVLNFTEQVTETTGDGISSETICREIFLGALNPDVLHTFGDLTLIAGGVARVRIMRDAATRFGVIEVQDGITFVRLAMFTFNSRAAAYSGLANHILLGIAVEALLDPAILDVLRVGIVHTNFNNGRRDCFTTTSGEPATTTTTTTAHSLGLLEPGKFKIRYKWD